MSGASTVLVVDDEETMRAMLRRVLGNEGFTVTTVGTVPEAPRMVNDAHNVSTANFPGIRSSPCSTAAVEKVSLPLSRHPERSQVSWPKIAFALIS
jgi:CheY-like chemotaxis protein